MPSASSDMSQALSCLSESQTRGGQVEIPTLVLPTLPDLPRLTGSTIPSVGRRFYIHSPSTILKLHADDGEASMTALAHAILGPSVPRVSARVSISGPPAQQGIIISHQPGTPLAELWPTLTPEQRTTAKAHLVDVLDRMRSHRFTYYGRPSMRPYVTPSDFGNQEHSFCRDRSQWDESRLHALRDSASEAQIGEERILKLESVQCGAGVGNSLVEAPVLTHGDISDRNILFDPTTLELTGFIDWECANVAPAYFEYAAARLSGGHDPDWRKELLEVLEEVLRRECEREARNSTSKQPEERFVATLVAWKALVDVERPAQGFSDACYWTFENRGPPVHA